MDTRKRERLEGFGFHSKGTFKKNKQAGEEGKYHREEIQLGVEGGGNLKEEAPSLKNNQNPPSPLLRQAQICRDWKLEKLGDLQRLEKMRN
ncbi:zinc finger CCCH domain-containing protein 14-like [Pyrus ussuriensis x Pyrus communis]|uniref:Zinc finger CCCH domain-containing protein 14-like n=1 Tax=Pyrus ussuriensis x Pyrus communis TaxID=2448454 RepID=A0A5N5HZJ4_9ROSA|nr:zinc finger CCCH domain-containing protein 14-like [Pyrus ussuriensis x Pyrus communis]